MNHFATNRATLASRRVELLRRLTRIEEDLERHGIDPVAHEDHGHPRSIARTTVVEVVETLGREIGRIESALRRIDLREYDCCLQCGGPIDPARLARLPYSVNCADCSTRYRLDSIEVLRGHHSSLRRAIFNVLHALNDTAERSSRSDRIELTETGSCLALLADLARHLPVRFEREERSGQLAEALAAAPRFSRNAAALVQQHGSFVQRADALVKEAEQISRASDALPRVRDRFREFALDLLAHEQAEADIVERAFLDDLGGID